MSVSKKIRFEIFKRDGFSCQYCGKTPPDVTLEVDHINPKSKNGTDDINNLITACFDCNRGKTNIPLNKIPNSLIENIEILKEKERQFDEYNKFLKKINKKYDSMANEIENVFINYFKNRCFSDSFRNVSVKNFCKKIPLTELINAMHCACSKVKDPNGVTKYFCGICWNIMREKTCQDQET